MTHATPRLVSLDPDFSARAPLAGKTVVCARCTGAYTPCMKEVDDQGHGCASRQADARVHALYGSAHDGDTWDICRPESVPAGVLCDGCIDVLAQSGAISPCPPQGSFVVDVEETNAADTESPEEEPYRDGVVPCARCGERYRNAMPGSTDQGYGCAVYTHEGTLRGAYGSVRYDFTVLRILDPGRVPEGVICDGCVDVLVESGAAVVEPHKPAASPWSNMTVAERDELLLMLEDSLAELEKDTAAETTTQTPPP